MDGLEERVAKIEGILEQMDKRFESMDKRFESMDKRFESMDKRFESMEIRLNHFGDEIKDVRQELRSNFKWLLGILITMWVTIMGTMVGFFVAILSK